MLLINNLIGCLGTADVKETMAQFFACTWIIRGCEVRIPRCIRQGDVVGGVTWVDQHLIAPSMHRSTHDSRWDRHLHVRNGLRPVRGDCQVGVRCWPAEGPTSAHGMGAVVAQFPNWEIGGVGDRSHIHLICKSCTVLNE